MSKFQGVGLNLEATKVSNKTLIKSKSIPNLKNNIKTVYKTSTKYNRCDRSLIKKNCQPINYQSNNGVQQNQKHRINFELPILRRDPITQENQQQLIQVQNCVLDANKIPRHVAIIMDGNSRWAKKRGLSVMEGHRAGCDALLRTVQNCLQLNSDIFQQSNSKNGLNVLTVFAFSLENLLRPRLEVEFLFKLFEQVLDGETQKLEQQGVRIKTFGDLSIFPMSLQRSIQRAEERSRNNSALVLNVGFGYGARQDIVSAARKLAKQAQQGLINVDEIDEQKFAQNLSFGECDVGAPDLLIRTSGEKRVSNFLLWECAYSEMVFIQPYWPDFNHLHLHSCIREFGERSRRFGKRNQQ